MSTPFKMKNSSLRMSAKQGTPMQANYASPAKQKPLEGEELEKIKMRNRAQNDTIAAAKQFDRQGAASSSTSDTSKKIFKGVKEKVQEREQIPSDYGTDSDYIDYHTAKTLRKAARKIKKNRKPATATIDVKATSQNKKKVLNEKKKKIMAMGAKIVSSKKQKVIARSKKLANKFLTMNPNIQ